MPPDAPGGTDDDLPGDLSHAGAVVDKAIEYMTEQNIEPISIGSALLGGAISLLSHSLGDRAVLGILRSAMASVENGELASRDAPAGRRPAA